MAHIKINAQDYLHNLKYVSNLANGVEKICIVLKDNAYGHGLETMAKLASKFGINKACVKNSNEAIKIKEYFNEILILSDIPEFICENFIIAANSIYSLKKIQNNSKIHLKINTGMNRNGILLSEANLALNIIKEKNLKLKGIFTHFSNADILDCGFYIQKQNFLKARNFFNKFKNISFHSHNSAALLRSKNFDESFARVGIASYGYHDLLSIFGNFNLKPVLSLYADKISTQHIKKSQKIGYGGRFEAPKDMIVSTYDVGYGDGLFRNFQKTFTTNEGKVLGTMNMDSISLECQKDEICVFNNVINLAKEYNTITYEILTKLSLNIKRVIV